MIRSCSRFSSRTPLSLFFLRRRGQSHRTCGAANTRVHLKDARRGVVDGGGRRGQILGQPSSARSSMSPMDSFRPRSVAAFSRSRRRRKVPSPRGFFRGDWPCGFLLLPWGPACCLRFGHAAIELDPASGILASRDGIEVVRNLGPPRGPTSLLFLGRCGTSQRACGAVIIPVRSEGRVDEGRGRGSHDAFLLDLAGSRRLLGEKVRSQGVLFRGFWKGARVILN